MPGCPAAGQEDGEDLLVPVRARQGVDEPADVLPHRLGRQPRAFQVLYDGRWQRLTVQAAGALEPDGAAPLGFSAVNRKFAFRNPQPAYRTAPATFSSSPSFSFFSSYSATMRLVVSSRPAMEAAFWRAVRLTLAGSMMPALIMSTYLSVAAS